MSRYVFHHNDDDGLCAAYIIKEKCMNDYELPTPKSFIEYNYSGDLTRRYPELNEGDTVYIVDLSLEEPIMELIRYCIKNNASVVHIDHHHTGIQLANTTYKEELDSYGEKYVRFMKEGVSGCMLCWIYGDLFDANEKKNPESVRWEFNDDQQREKVCLVDNTNHPIHSFSHEPYPEGTGDKFIPPIPDAIRMIDDNDIWKHAIQDTKPFSAGFQIVEDKHPLNNIWLQIIHEDMKTLASIVEHGKIILKYRKSVDGRNLRNGFLVNINDKKIAFLNTPEGNSSIFQDIYDHVDAVCKYAYDGIKWTYTFYSRENGGADVSKIIEYLKNGLTGEMYHFISGGGHVHAAGCSFEQNFLSSFETDKHGYIDLRKEIRVEIEIAKEQAIAEEMERKKREQDEKVAKLRAKVLGQLEEDEEDYGI